jgi:Cof subfamily protein (haloacid dehalogenase superfamily)
VQRYRGYLICCDCDGTLTNSQGILSKENARAIREFQNNGGLFTVATGRFPDFLRKFEPDFRPNTHIIAINGTMIYDMEQERVLYAKTLPNEAEQVVRYVGEHYPNLKEVRFVHSIGQPTYYIKGETAELKELIETVQRPWYKLVFCQPAEDTLRLQEDLKGQFGKQYHFDRSWPEGLEMHPWGTGKGACVERLKRLIHTPIHTTICIGDFENDITMLQAADIGYAVDNAIDSVKAAADRVTVSNDCHAVATVIRSI